MSMKHQQVPQSSEQTDRAQTTLDFSFGLVVFLAALIFTFLSIPTIVGPFTETSASETAIANDAAAHFAQEAFKPAAGSPPATAQTRVDRACVVGFFAGDSSQTTRCGFTHTARDIETEYTVPTGTSLQLRIEYLNGTVVEQTAAGVDGRPELQAGVSQPSEATTTRLIQMNERTYALVVEVA